MEKVKTNLEKEKGNTDDTHSSFISQVASSILEDTSAIDDDVLEEGDTSIDVFQELSNFDDEDTSDEEEEVTEVHQSLCELN